MEDETPVRTCFYMFYMRGVESLKICLDMDTL